MPFYAGMFDGAELYFEKAVFFMQTDRKRCFGCASGRVQGVGFRYFVQSQSQLLGVTGWVKNMEDGTVTMELQGTMEQLAQLTAKIRAGSFFIKVEQLQLQDMAMVDGETSFEIRY